MLTDDISALVAWLSSSPRSVHRNTANSLAADEVVRQIRQGGGHAEVGIAGGMSALAAGPGIRSLQVETGRMVHTRTRDLVEQIRRLMFVFEDIKLVDDKGIQQILKDHMPKPPLSEQDISVMHATKTPAATLSFVIPGSPLFSCLRSCRSS